MQSGRGQSGYVAERFIRAVVVDLGRSLQSRRGLLVTFRSVKARQG